VIAGIATDPVLQFALQAAAALLFLGSAAHKLRDPSAFRSALEAYAVIPKATLAPAAPLLAFAEIAVGFGLLFSATAPAAAIGGAGLLSVYGAAIAVNVARGRDAIDCGCGGPGGKRPLSRALVLRNVVLVGALLLAALPSRVRPTVWIDAVSAVSLCATLALLYAAVDVALANSARLRVAGGAPWKPA
jgi:uncharacterized membrane protein YphA (DoxX/SURF4 family)